MTKKWDKCTICGAVMGIDSPCANCGHRHRSARSVAEKVYRDTDGNECSLDTLCRREPAWAVNRIRAELARVSVLRAALERHVCQHVGCNPVETHAGCHARAVLADLFRDG